MKACGSLSAMRPPHVARRAGLMFLAMTAPTACGSLDQARDAFCAQRPEVCDASVPMDAGADGGSDAGAPDGGLGCLFVTDAGTGSVSGTVTSIHSGSPLSGANVWWGAVAGVNCTTGVNCVSTDSNGHYVLLNVATGCIIVTGKANGYLLRHFELVIDAGTSTPLDLALSTSGTLSGTVRWADG